MYPDVLSRLRHDFPKAVWETNPFYPGRNDPKALIRVFIPSDQLSEDSGRVLFIQRAEDARWTRNYYSENGMGRGVILTQDRTAQIISPVPPDVQRNSFWPYPGSVFSSKISGTFDAGEQGRYVFSTETENQIDFWVDGSLLFSSHTNRKKKFKKGINLDKGSHQVLLITHHDGQVQMPKIDVSTPNGGMTTL